MNLGTHGTAVQRYVPVRTGLYQNWELLMQVGAFGIDLMRSIPKLSNSCLNFMPQLGTVTCRIRWNFLGTMGLSWAWETSFLTPTHIIMPRKSRAKPKDVDLESLNAPKPKCSPDIQWAKNPNWTFILISYLGNHVSFCLKLFSDLTADATKEGCMKHTAKDGKIQQYAILAKHIFAAEPGQSVLYLQNPGRYGTAVEARLRQYDDSRFFIYLLCHLTCSFRLKAEYIQWLKKLPQCLYVMERHMHYSMIT